MSDPKTAAPKPDWQKALDGLAAEGSGPFFFLKAAKTQIRLVNLEQDPTHFFLPVASNFRGQVKTKYIVFGIVKKTDTPLQDKWVDAIVPIAVSKTVVKGILSLLAEGYDLFDPKEGYGVTIVKTGRGLDTDYNLMPSPHPVAVDMEKVKQPEKTLEDFAAEFTTRQQNKGGGGGKAEEEGGW